VTAGFWRRILLLVSQSVSYTRAVGPHTFQNKHCKLSLWTSKSRYNEQIRGESAPSSYVQRLNPHDPIGLTSQFNYTSFVLLHINEETWRVVITRTGGVHSQTKQSEHLIRPHRDKAYYTGRVPM